MEQKAFSVFMATLEIQSPEELERYLDETCKSDPELRRRVEELLHTRSQAEDFLIPEEDDEILEGPGTVIGHYKLLEKIGEGGFGVVFMAEQVEPIHRRLALKIVKPGMDTKQVIARFEAERQALALMDHPNIARVIDAGATEGGRPYFVMELVHGVPITKYCDAAKLTREERINLFIPVCEAIQHAHQKGIIHRDIKPSNVLVTLHDGNPVPKVIDFGTAKALQQRLTERTMFTAYGRYLGTPQYMSPEQAEMSGLDVDTRADVYSLGVLLYELLTGTTPFEAEQLRSMAFDRMMCMLREEDPPKPSTRISTLGERAIVIAQQRRDDPRSLRRALQGDLDWIVMKALDKSRQRRYETANGLAMDLKRHLAMEPVLARPHSKFYEFQKTVRRHKVGFAATAGIIMVLFAGVVVSSWQAHLAQLNEKKATLAAAQSAQVAQFMKDMLKGVGPSVALGRDTALLREILDRTAERIGNELTGQPEVELELRNAISDAYWAIGQHTQAESNYRKTVELTRKLYGNKDPALAESLHRLAECLRRQAKYAEAETLELEALAIYRRVYGEEHPAMAGALNNLIHVYASMGQIEKAEEAGRRALAMNEKLLDEEDPAVGVSLSRLGDVLLIHGKLEEAETMERRAVALQKKLLEHQSPDRDPLELPWALYRLARVLQQEGMLSDAESFFREAVVEGKKVLGVDHPDLQFFLGDLVNILRDQRKLAAAAEVLNQQIAWLSAPSGEESTDLMNLKVQLIGIQMEQNEGANVEELLNSNNLTPSDEIAKTLGDIAYQLRQAEKHAASESVYRMALDIQTHLHGDESSEAAAAMTSLARQLNSMKRFKESEQLTRKAIEIQARELGRISYPFIDALGVLGDAMHRQGKLAEAEAIYVEAIDIESELRRMGEPTWGIAFWFNDNLGTLLSRQGRYAEAEAVLRNAVDIRNEGWTDTIALKIDPVYGLATALKKQGKYADAEDVYRQELTRRRMLPNPGIEKYGLDQHAVLLSFRLAELQCRQGKKGDVSTLYEAALQKARPWLLNEMAWSLATSYAQDFRDGPTAVRLSEKLVEATNRSDATHLDTLAAAYAEAGDFSHAVRVQQEAIALLHSQEKHIKDDYYERLRLYESGMPYHNEE